MRLTRTRRACVVVAATTLALGGTSAASSASTSSGAPSADTAKQTSQTAQAADRSWLARQLVRQSTLAGANRHLVALQRVADRNGGNRASNTPGYDASVDYVAARLRAAGFDVTTPSYTYDEEVSLANSLTVGSAVYQADIMTFSPQTPVGGVTAPLAVVPEDATTGCEAGDFAGAAYTGKIAVIRRGGCSFAIKAQNAAAAGAVSVVVTNNVAGPLNGTLGSADAGVVPTAGVSQADGDLLAGQNGVTGTLDLRYETVERTSRNVIAQTRTGDQGNVVMAGAHLDSVPVGPGINDNGSGSASLLEVATRLGASPKVRNAVRFAWWGSEELGLLGSSAYVAGLSADQQLDIALYLNFDMTGSPNAAYFVYDGDDSDEVGAGPGPFGSAQIEKTFVDFLGQQRGVETEGTDFSGRSDYGPFIAVGIPSGGLFTGAEGIKTEAQAAKWGGTAGVAYDPCYHQACDNLGNLDRVALDRNLDAIAWAIGTYAISTASVNGNGVASSRVAATDRAAERVPVDASAAHWRAPVTR